MIITRICRRLTKQICMGIYRFQNAGKYQKKLDILVWSFSRIKKINSVICCNRPVIMFTRTVNTGKRFFMKKTFHAMFACNFFQCLHYNLIMIYRNICLGINRCKFVLCRGNFIMLCFCSHAKFPEFLIYIFHKSSDSLTNRSKIMIVQFLPFRRHCAKQRTSCKHQIFSLQIFIPIHKEILLFNSN